MKYLQIHPQPCSCAFCGAERKNQEPDKPKIDGNEPAFPVHPQCSGQPCGISIRTLLSAIAMNGILAANAKCADEVTDKNVDYVVAREAVRSADALLEELNR